MLRWPSELPKPTARRYSGEPLSAVQRTESDRGELRVRPIGVNTPERVMLAWPMSGAEFRVARAFFRYALHGGADSCTMPLYIDGQGYVDQIVKFEAEPKWAIRGVDTYTVEAPVRVTDRFARVLNRELTYADDGASPTPALDPGDTPASFTVTRVDVWVTEAFDGDTTNTLDLGWTADDDALVAGLDISTLSTDPVTIVAGHGNAGVSLGVLQSGARAIEAVITATASATAGRLVVVAYYE